MAEKKRPGGSITGVKRYATDPGPVWHFGKDGGFGGGVVEKTRAGVPAALSGDTRSQDVFGNIQFPFTGVGRILPSELFGSFVASGSIDSSAIRVAIGAGSFEASGSVVNSLAQRIRSAVGSFDASGSIEASSSFVIGVSVVGTNIGYDTLSADIPLTLPGGTVVGDMMILCCGMDRSGGGADGQIDTPTSGGTWTQLDVSQDTNYACRVFYRVVGASEPSPTGSFTDFGGTPDNFAALIVLSNAATPTTENTDLATNSINHDITHTEDATGWTIIAGILSDNGTSVDIDGSLDNGDPFTEVTFDAVDGANDGAFFMIYRENANRGAQQSGVRTSVDANTDHAIIAFQVDV